MLYGRFPFKAQTQKELFEKITEAKFEFSNGIEINEKIKILLLKLFVTIPPQRSSLQEILNDIFLLNFNFCPIREKKIYLLKCIKSLIYSFNRKQKFNKI